MPALTMATHEQQLVLDAVILAAARVEVLDPVVETLPLGLDTLGVEVLVRWVGPVDETKVDRGLSQAVSKSFRTEMFGRVDNKRT